jgi:hypothetical protein
MDPGINSPCGFGQLLGTRFLTKSGLPERLQTPMTQAGKNGLSPGARVKPLPDHRMTL